MIRPNLRCLHLFVQKMVARRLGDVAHQIDFGTIASSEVSPGQHVPILYEALQRCGASPKAVSFCALDDAAETVAATVTLSDVQYKLKVTGVQKPELKRTNESWADASLRVAKHKVAGYLLANARFQASMEACAALREAEKEAEARARESQKAHLPTMTDLIASQYIDSGLFQVYNSNFSADLLNEEGPYGVSFAIDAEGFDAARQDWHRAWLVQLAWCFEQEMVKPPIDRVSGHAMVLLIREDKDMDIFAAWLSERAKEDIRIYWFDRQQDIRGIFRTRQEPNELRAKSVDLKDYGSSLHSIAGDKILGTPVRKNELMSQSLSFLAQTQGVTPLQARYAASDAIATLLLGLHLDRRVPLC